MGEAPLDVRRLMRPRTAAIVGAAPEAGSIGGNTAANLELIGFAGEVHYVSRNRKELKGKPCVASIDELPLGIDTVVLVVPEAAVEGAVEACVRRRAGSAIVFASGFAEMGADGRARQDAIAAAARAGGLVLLGPNCIGLTNHVDGVAFTFEPFDRIARGVTNGVAIVAQSGAMTGNVRLALETHGVPVTHAVSTGNEAVAGLEDFFAYLLDDDAARVILLFVEQVRRPALFRELLRRARDKRVPVVLMHPGRTARARESAVTHTGALAGDHAAMAALLRREEAILVDTMDELFDVATLLARWPAPPTGGAAVVTNSGAFRGVALDLAAEIGLELPKLAPATAAALGAQLPAYALVDNPLDITTVGIAQPQLFGTTAAAMLADPAIGSLILAYMPGSAALQRARAAALLPVVARAVKPVAFSLFGDGSPLAAEFTDAFAASGVPLFRSPDRALRAMAHLAAYGRARAGRSAAPPPPPLSLPPPGSGTIPEHRAKAWLAAAGVAVPAGALAGDVAAAEAAAARLGYPVALKAQAAALSHKSDAGGVVLGITDAAGLRAGWARMHADLARARPGLALDGVLVERMAEPGLELIVGARRDPEWGPVLLLGLGGVWTEILGDVRVVSAELDADAILAELRLLKGAALFEGRRGRPPADLAAAARAAALVGRLMRGTPAVREIDINPLSVNQAGAVALDALIVAD